MIRYLRKEEAGKSRELYCEAFPEDSKSFTDYYYTEKVKKNRILVDEEDDKIKAMLHQNPYNMSFNASTYEIDYIVAVATGKEYRRQGLMRNLLYKSLNNMYSENKPFTFLLPADKAYYEPFDFDFISDFYEAEPDKNKNVVSRLYDDRYRTKLTDFMIDYFKKYYQLYCIRDEAYIEWLIKELKSEDGFIELLCDNDKIVGYKLIWGLEKKELRAFVLEKSYTKAGIRKKEAYMARIVDLREFLKNIPIKRSRKEKELVLYIRVKDQIIKENNACFRWTLTKDGSSIEYLTKEEESLHKLTELDIKALSGYLFGYGDMYDAELGEYVERVGAVYIDEVV
jgi:hypothetical protein